MVGEMGLARLAAVDALGVEVDVVGEAHPCLGFAWGWAARQLLRATLLPLGLLFVDPDSTVLPSGLSICVPPSPPTWRPV